MHQWPLTRQPNITLVIYITLDIYKVAEVITSRTTAKATRVKGVIMSLALHY